MLHINPGRQKAIRLKREAEILRGCAEKLARVKGRHAYAAINLAVLNLHRAKQLEDMANSLAYHARLDDITIGLRSIKKRNKKNEITTHSYWVCSWKKDGKVINKYLGSTNKVSQSEALEKARRMKAEALGLYSSG